MCKKCRYFPTLLWPLQWFLLVYFVRKNPHPCFTRDLGPTRTHSHALWGSLCASLPGTAENEKKYGKESPVFPSRSFCFYLGSLVGVVLQILFFTVLFLSQVNLYLAGLEGLPASPPLPVHTGALTSQSSGALVQSPCGFLSLLGAWPAVSQVAAPTVLWGARSQ